MQHQTSRGAHEAYGLSFPKSESPRLKMETKRSRNSSVERSPSANHLKAPKKESQHYTSDEESNSVVELKIEPKEDEEEVKQLSDDDEEDNVSRHNDEDKVSRGNSSELTSFEIW